MADYESFVRERLPRLLRYATMLTGEREQAADLVQDVLVKVYRRWSRICAADQPDRYVLRMVTNGYLSWRHSRSARLVATGELPDEARPDDFASYPGDRSLYVGVSDQRGSTVPAKRLVDAGRRIAEHVRFPGTTTVTPVFGLRDLPTGMKICAFDVAGPSEFRSEPSTLYSLGTCTTSPPITVGGGVDEDPPGAPVLVAGEVPLTDLYDIANRLVLPRS